MRGLGEDLRQGARALRRRPGFAAATSSLLALAIGAAVGVFSVVDDLQLRPLPLPAPQELQAFVLARPGGDAAQLSYPEFLDYRAGLRSFAGVAGWCETPAALVSDGTTRHAWGVLCSGDYFDVLGVRPFLGRLFTTADDLPGAEPAVVISHELWRRSLAAGEDLLGRTLALNGIAFQVVGVAPREFHGLTRGFAPEFWIPVVHGVRVSGDSEALTSRSSRWFSVFGRLAPGVGPTPAAAEASAMERSIAAAHPRASTIEERLALRPLSHGSGVLVHRASRLGLLLLGGVGLLLLLACANLSALLLARNAARQREIAVRQALGARVGRLARLLLRSSRPPAGWWGCCSRAGSPISWRLSRRPPPCRSRWSRGWTCARGSSPWV